MAWSLAGRGEKTVVVKRSMVGGSCPNVACLHSKNVIHSAKTVSLVHPSKGLGVTTGSMRVDMAGVARRNWRIVNELVETRWAAFPPYTHGVPSFRQRQNATVANMRGEKPFFAWPIR
jgi:pyruvate/2-oxoglutarate dehydrogenase complex dihydrolipoamide dehydrogenase (E3) component